MRRNRAYPEVYSGPSAGRAQVNNSVGKLFDEVLGYLPLSRAALPRSSSDEGTIPKVKIGRYMIHEYFQSLHIFMFI